MTIAEAARRTNEAVAGIDNQIDVILNEIEPEIVAMQTDRLFEGLTVSGDRIIPEYTPYTVSEKQSKNQPSDRVTLLDTGAFYNAIYAAKIGDEVIIESGDEKNDELLEKYGEQIFGLTDDNSDKSKEITTGKIIGYVKEVTGFN